MSKKRLNRRAPVYAPLLFPPEQNYYVGFNIRTGDMETSSVEGLVLNADGLSLCAQESNNAMDQSESSCTDTTNTDTSQSTSQESPCSSCGPSGKKKPRRPDLQLYQPHATRLSSNTHSPTNGAKSASEERKRTTPVKSSTPEPKPSRRNHCIMEAQGELVYKKSQLVSSTEGNELPSDELPSDFDTEEGSPSLEKIVQNTNVVVRTRANNPPSGSPSTPPDGEIPILDSNSSSANPPLISQKRAHDLVAIWDQNSENRLRGRVKRNARQIQRDHTYNEIQCEVAESFIDSHCHIDFIFNRGKGTDWRQTESGCWHNYFRGCIPNFIDPRLFLARYYDECDLGWIEEQLQDPLVLGATYGCHPHYGSEHEHEIDEILMPMINEKEKFKTLAIGECGLDYKRSEVDPAVQKNVFQKQLQLAKDHELPLVVHCRSGSKGDAETDCLDIMRGMGLSRFHNIHRHCFTGSWEVAKRWMRQYENIYFGFTSVCAAWENSEGERQKYEVLEKLPLRRMLLETDAPYFRPTQYDYNKGPKGCEKLSFPPMAVNVAFVIARAKNINVNEVIKVTTSNAMRMYCIKDFDD